VPTTLTDSIGRIRAQHGRKLFRFGAVSAFNVVFGQILLYGAQTVIGWSPVSSNIFAVAMGTIPGYILSRHWVWEKRGKSHFMREVLPFWILTFIGFALSTAAVWFVAGRWDPAPIVINLTSLASFGVVWVAKFVILDRVLFKSEETATVS
jgi:putative flippase GtrA